MQHLHQTHHLHDRRKRTLDERPCAKFQSISPYPKDARTVGDLPRPAERIRALQQATERLGYWLGLPVVRRIPFGSPVYLAYGMDVQTARAHPLSSLLLLRGMDLNLTVGGAGQSRRDDSPCIDGRGSRSADCDSWNCVEVTA